MPAGFICRMLAVIMLLCRPGSADCSPSPPSQCRSYCAHRRALGLSVIRQMKDSSSVLPAGRDLRAIFALLRKDGSGRIPQRSVLLLLRSLTFMARHLGPTTFFNFADDGAGIMRNTPLRFPGAPLPQSRPLPFRSSMHGACRTRFPHARSGVLSC